MELLAVPTTAARWGDVVRVLGGPRPKPTSCWCQRFCVHDERDNQAALGKEIETADVAVGVLAYVDGEPAGWSRVVPRKSLPGIEGNTAIRRLVADDEAGWWVTCCVVRREHRGHGVGVVLLTAAVEHARNHGASVLDGHPVDVSRLRARPSPAALFTGTSSSFDKAGFTEIGRTYPSRPVMRAHFDDPQQHRQVEGVSQDGRVSPVNRSRRGPPRSAHWCSRREAAWVLPIDRSPDARPWDRRGCRRRTS